MKKAYIIAFLVISVAMGFTLWRFKDTMTPYTDIAGARKSELTVQVRGKILHDTARTTITKSTRCASHPGRQRRDRSRWSIMAPKPDCLRYAPRDRGARHGRQRRDRAGSLHLGRLVVKCPSKYDDNKRRTRRRPPQREKSNMEKYAHLQHEAQMIANAGQTHHVDGTCTCDRSRLSPMPWR